MTYLFIYILPPDWRKALPFSATVTGGRRSQGPSTQERSPGQ